SASLPPAAFRRSDRAPSPWLSIAPHGRGRNRPRSAARGSAHATGNDQQIGDRVVRRDEVMTRDEVVTREAHKPFQLFPPRMRSEARKIRQSCCLSLCSRIDFRPRLPMFRDTWFDCPFDRFLRAAAKAIVSPFAGRSWSDSRIHAVFEAWLVQQGSRRREGGRLLRPVTHTRTGHPASL